MPGTKKAYRQTLYDPVWLAQRYTTEGLSAAAIGQLVGAPTSTVMRALRATGLVVGLLQRPTETRACPECGATFTVGGRGHAPRSQVFCSSSCAASQERPGARGSHAPRPRKGHETLHSESWLRARYVDDHLSLRQIAGLAGASHATVRWALRKYGIPTRESGVAKRISDARRPRRTVTKAEMAAAYGGCCQCCGETELVFLSLDHIGGGGSAHRRSFAGNGGRKLLQELKAAGWPKDGYRVLCMNCQFGYRYGNTCPHQVVTG